MKKNVEDENHENEKSNYRFYFQFIFAEPFIFMRYRS